ncbi:VCBS repeat-containing protein [Geomonas sp. Red32]|uniref:FG-GAP repeat domain-containing protein n=1 Tax=Geomonas sp. Red32 TaxID=2912856 RepID=UPI00202CCE08|nr:VCBS repeat-containing protein [Geomonas sp. Red32]MCM0082567.1 VCBS repeat-containing protein [Geomonas sp. Red32]
MKFNAVKVAIVLLFVAVFGLSGCGGGGGAPAPGDSLITSVGWYFDNVAPADTSNGETCVLNVLVYYNFVAASDIQSFSVTSPTGWTWTIPAQNFQTGTSSSGKPYVRAGIYYGANPNAFPLGGAWTAKITLNNGQTSSKQVTLHDPGSATDATHQYIYTQEDWTPSSADQPQYEPALARFPSQGYTVTYSAANGGSITTTGFAAVRTSYLANEPRAYNMLCWLYDANKTYLGNTTGTYSTQDHSSTNLIGGNGEVSITPAATTSPTGQVDLSLVRYVRFVYLDGAQYAPSSYSKADYRSISSLVDVDKVSFAAAVRYPVPDSIGTFWGGDTAMGDLNGDGRNDIAVMEENGQRILVYYQNANGTFDPPQVITTSLMLKGIAIKDINNDGLADLVVTGNASTPLGGWLGRMVVYKQDPATHTFNAPQEFALSTNTAGKLAIADLNSDGLPDIVVASPRSSGNGVLSFFFQGAGGTLGTEHAYTSVPVVGEIHVADMNSDGRNDVVVQSDAKQLAVIKQTSPGVFSTSPDFYTVQTSYWMSFESFALGDLNGDGRPDIAVADPGNSGYLNIFLQNSTGTLTGPTTINFTTSVQDEVKIADMDGDGLNDILILSYGHEVMLLRQYPDHTFKYEKSYYLPNQTWGGTVVHQAMAIGDVTGDGLPDVVASWSTEGLFVLPRR